MYTKTYHRACGLLIGGGLRFHGTKAQCEPMRKVIARALRELHRADPKRALRERYHLRQIRGCFPGEVR